jgi:hypothetical protein
VRCECGGAESTSGRCIAGYTAAHPTPAPAAADSFDPFGLDGLTLGDEQSDDMFG